MTLENAMNEIRSIESAQYGYTKYRTRIDACFSKVIESDCDKLMAYGLFMLSTQDETSQDALLTAFRAGFLSPKQQKATGKPVAVPASTPTTAVDFLRHRLDAALRAFGELNAATLCSSIEPQGVTWSWETLMLDSDFSADYQAIKSYELRFAAFVEALPFTPTTWRPVSDSHIELSIDLATFATIQPQPQSARFDNGDMRWVVPVTEPVEPTTPKATPKAKVTPK